MPELEGMGLTPRSNCTLSEKRSRPFEIRQKPVREVFARHRCDHLVIEEREFTQKLEIARCTFRKQRTRLHRLRSQS